MALMFYRNAQGPSSRTQELIDFCMLRTMHHDDDEEEETYDERKKNSTIFTKSPKEKAAILALERNVEQERESIRRQRIEDEKRLRRQLKEKRSMRLDDEERLSYLSMIGNPLRSNKPESSIEPDRSYHAEEQSAQFSKEQKATA